MQYDVRYAHYWGMHLLGYAPYLIEVCTLLGCVPYWSVYLIGACTLLKYARIFSFVQKGKKMMKLCAKNEQDLKVVDVEGKGKGVVPTRPFHHSELICEYPGELVSAKEARSREEEYTKDSSIGCYMYYFTHNGSKWWYVLTFVELVVQPQV